MLHLVAQGAQFHQLAVDGREPLSNELHHFPLHLQAQGIGGVVQQRLHHCEGDSEQPETAQELQSIDVRLIVVAISILAPLRGRKQASAFVIPDSSGINSRALRHLSDGQSFAVLVRAW